jgi:hypothetical protein
MDSTHQPQTFAAARGSKETDDEVPKEEKAGKKKKGAVVVWSEPHPSSLTGLMGFVQGMQESVTALSNQ